MKVFKFKKGDKVKITSTSEFYNEFDRNNPINTIGTIYKIETDSPWADCYYHVKWKKDITNSYRECDLELAELTLEDLVSDLRNTISDEDNEIHTTNAQERSIFFKILDELSIKHVYGKNMSFLLDDTYENIYFTYDKHTKELSGNQRTRDKKTIYFNDIIQQFKEFKNKNL